MASFIQQPTDTVIPAFRAGGVSFVVTHTDLAVRVAPALMVKFFLNNIEFLPRAYMAPTNITVNLPDKTSTFEIECEDFLKKAFDLRASVPPNTANGSVVMFQTARKFKISITAWLGDADNILQEDATEVFSNEYQVLPVVRNHGQSQDIVLYTNAEEGWKWLTNKPTSITPRNGHEFAAVYVKGGGPMAIYVVSFDKDGAYLDTNIYNFSSLSGTDRVLTLGVGAQNVNAIPYSSSTGNPPVTALTARYDIFVGYVGGNQSDTQTYYLDSKNPRYVLHYINPYGYMETTHIYADADDVIEFDGETIETVLPKHTATSGVGRWDLGRGSVDVSKVGRKGFTALMQNLRPVDMEWIPDLLISPLVYLEGADGKFIPVVVRNNSHEVKQTGQPREIELEVVYANTINSQTNYAI